MDHNLNIAECLTTQTNWGESIIHNICSGQVHAIPWGTMNYVGVIGGAAVVCVFLAVFSAMAISIIRDL
jgi:hypothetical protein